MPDKTRAEKLAFTLNWIADKGECRGLHPAEVRKAAALLVEQEKELALAQAALAAKSHVVEVEVQDEGPYAKRVRGTFIITDPRVYLSEVMMDPYIAATGGPAYLEHLVRSLVAAATDDWRKDLVELAYAAVRKATQSEPAPV